MLVNDLDLGAPSHPWLKPVTGQNLNSIVIEGVEEIVWSRGSVQRKQTVSFFVQQWQASGGATAKSQQATKYLLRQLEELSSNSAMQPAYIQWTATADPGGVLNASDLHDGWYLIDDFEPDYENFIVSGIVKCRMTVTLITAANSASSTTIYGVAYAGGGLTTTYSGGSRNILTYPFGVLDFGVYGGNRPAAQGPIVVQTPRLNPSIFYLQGAVSDFFKGAVEVYDTVNTGSNPIPTSGYVNANWLKVYNTSHVFQGDCVVTNGLLMLLFDLNVQRVCYVYMWNSPLAIPAWTAVGNLNVSDSVSNGTNKYAYNLLRISPFEVAILTENMYPTQGEIMEAVVRLQRGRYEGRLDITPRSVANNSGQIVYLGLPVNLKMIYNSAKVQDVTVGEVSTGVPTDYGYGAAFINSVSYPFISGLFYVSPPNSNQPSSYGSSATVIAGDTTSLAQNVRRSYGFFACPFGSLANVLSCNQASLEVDTTGWAATLNCTITRSNTQALDGSWSLRLSSTAAGRMDAATPGGTSGFPVTALSQYTALASFRTAVTAQTVKVYIFWFQGSGAASSHPQDSSTGAADSSAGWHLEGVTVNAPADAAFAQVVVSVNNTAGAAELHYVDEISLALGSSVTWTPGKFSTVNLVGEAESATLGGSWVSAADGAGSGGNVAKLPSGSSVTSHLDNIVGNISYPAGNYAVWFRMKAGSAGIPGGTTHIGVWNQTTLGSPVNTVTPTLTTSYLWYLAGTIATNGTDSFFAFASYDPGTGNTARDWFVDEAAFVPLSIYGVGSGPQEIWQQFMYDRSVRLIRP